MTRAQALLDSDFALQDHREEEDLEEQEDEEEDEDAEAP